MPTYQGPDMTLNKQISPSPARRGPEPAGPGRARLSRAERGSVQVTAAAVAGFCIYGFATGSPSTVGYVSSVIVIGAAIAHDRQERRPDLARVVPGPARVRGRQRRRVLPSPSLHIRDLGYRAGPPGRAEGPAS